MLNCHPISARMTTSMQSINTVYICWHFRDFLCQWYSQMYTECQDAGYPYSHQSLHQVMLYIHYDYLFITVYR